MRSFTDTMTEIVSWDELKMALYFAAKQYHDNPAARKTRGIFHGDTGVLRAKNLMRLTASDSTISHDDLFLLLNAVSSRSGGLTNYIAEKLFAGEYKTCFIITGEHYMTDTLTSRVFSVPFLSYLKDQSFALDTTATEASKDEIFDKFSAIKGIIDHLKEKYVSDADYKKYLQNTVEFLETEPVSQGIQLLTVPMLKS